MALMISSSEIALLTHICNERTRRPSDLGRLASCWFAQRETYLMEDRVRLAEQVKRLRCHEGNGSQRLQVVGGRRHLD